MHLVWKTWDHLPLTTLEVRELLYPVLLRKAREMGCSSLAVGGVEDHVHLLISFRPTVYLSDVVKELKGTSSRAVGLELPKRFFKWEGSYGAISVSPADLDPVTLYIEKQAEHHRRGDCDADLETFTEPDES